MVPNVTTFVLLACACVTINATLAPLKLACMKIREGSTAGFKRNVRPIILPQGLTDWEMPLPKCLGEMGGVDVEVCNDDDLPSVKITEWSTVVLHTTKNMDSYTIVHITLYCLSPQDQLSSVLYANVGYTSMDTMAAVTSLLVLSCAWAAAVAYPLGTDQCGLIQTGSAIGNGIPLAKTSLQPGVADFKVLIPDIPNCPNGPIGVLAVVCDFDVLPSASFLSTNIISVHRVGSFVGEGSVTPTVYCGNAVQNNQPLLQNNQLWLSNNQLQNDVTLHSHLWGQSPQSVHGQSYLPPLGLSSRSLLGQTHSPLLGQSQLSLLWGQSPQSVYGQPSLPSLSVTPLSQLDPTHNPLLGQSQLSLLWGQSPQSVYGQSSLPSLSVTPLSQLDYTHNLLGQSQNSVWGQSPQSVYGQLSLPSLSVTPLSQLDHTHNLLGQSQNSVWGQSPHLLLGQSSLPLLGQSPLLMGQSSPPQLGQSSLMMGLLGNSPHNLIAQAY